ncbi:hypothetical protein BDZ97DRAFT_1783319, partial [Flammula alnicola]
MEGVALVILLAFALLLPHTLPYPFNLVAVILEPILSVLVPHLVIASQPAQVDSPTRLTWKHTGALFMSVNHLVLTRILPVGSIPNFSAASDPFNYPPPHRSLYILVPIIIILSEQVFHSLLLLGPSPGCDLGQYGEFHNWLHEELHWLRDTLWGVIDMLKVTVFGLVVTVNEGSGALRRRMGGGRQDDGRQDDQLGPEASDLPSYQFATLNDRRVPSLTDSSQKIDAL